MTNKTCFLNKILKKALLKSIIQDKNQNNLELKSEKMI